MRKVIRIIYKSGIPVSTNSHGGYERKQLVWFMVMYIFMSSKENSSNAYKVYIDQS